MNLITILGIVSFVITVVFTLRAYFGGCNGNGQTRRQSIIEVWVNIIIGFSINYIMNMLLLPLVGANITFSDNFWLGWVYTAVSILRQYGIRRWFNNMIHDFAVKLAKEK